MAQGKPQQKREKYRERRVRYKYRARGVQAGPRSETNGVAQWTIAGSGGTKPQETSLLTQGAQESFQINKSRARQICTLVS